MVFLHQAMSVPIILLKVDIPRTILWPVDVHPHFDLELWKVFVACCKAKELMNGNDGASFNVNLSFREVVDIKKMFHWFFYQRKVNLKFQRLKRLVSNILWRSDLKNEWNASILLPLRFLSEIQQFFMLHHAIQLLGKSGSIKALISTCYLPICII